MILMTLRLYATGGMMRTIGDLFGISVSSVSRITTIVTHHIALLRSKFITFPSTATERENASKAFYAFARFPKTNAVIDCTHVRIISPGGDNAELYRNRKGFFSINVQTTCDANLMITNIVARWPGSAHDSNIFNNSRLCSLIEDGNFGTNIIVADGGYKNTKSVLTPLLNPTKPEEILYNESIIRTRCCVERSYGVWKRRFPILSLGIRLNNKKVQGVIVATAVLHNVCYINSDTDLPSLPLDLSEAIDHVLSVPHSRNNLTLFDNTSNNQTRSNLVNNYFKNML